MTNAVNTVEVSKVRLRCGHAGGSDRVMGATIEISVHADTCAQTEEFVRARLTADDPVYAAAPDLLAALAAACDTIAGCAASEEHEPMRQELLSHERIYRAALAKARPQ